MRWGYKTIHFGMKKDGILGNAFLDETEIEVTLNEYGKSGWELVSFMEVSDGLIAVFKQPFDYGLPDFTEEEPIREELPEIKERVIEKVEPVPLEPAHKPHVDPMQQKENVEPPPAQEETLERNENPDVGTIRIF